MEGRLDLLALPWKDLCSHPAVPICSQSKSHQGNGHQYSTCSTHPSVSFCLAVFKRAAAAHCMLNSTILYSRWCFKNPYTYILRFPEQIPTTQDDQTRLGGQTSGLGLSQLLSHLLGLPWARNQMTRLHECQSFSSLSKHEFLNFST